MRAKLPEKSNNTFKNYNNALLYLGLYEDPHANLEEEVSLPQ